jgi:hypothetical protein
MGVGRWVNCRLTFASNGCPHQGQDWALFATDTSNWRKERGWAFPMLLAMDAGALKIVVPKQSNLGNVKKKAREGQ